MTNDNKNVKELVSVDQERTPELELSTLPNPISESGSETVPDLEIESTKFDIDFSPVRNRDAVIQDLKADLRIKTETIDRLRFDVERLKSRRIALETEIRAREAQTRRLAGDIEEANKQIDTLRSALDRAKKFHDDVADRLAKSRAEHEHELRTVRFELTEAAATVAQQELINEQLASDLADTRSFKNELERMLTSSEHQNQAHVDQLEKEVQQLRKANSDYEAELATKNEAIGDLLEELSGKVRQDDSIRELEAAIQELDDRMSARLEARQAIPATNRNRMSRVLIGKIADQELRFPLFKKRLTIGRTQKNDIQLQAPQISRRHAVLMTEGDVTRLIDWGSKNGVYVNSCRVTEHFLASGDVVAIGDAKFRYEERPKRGP